MSKTKHSKVALTLSIDKEGNPVITGMSPREVSTHNRQAYTIAYHKLLQAISDIAAHPNAVRVLMYLLSKRELNTCYISGITQKTLSDATGIDAPSMSRALKVLREHSCVSEIHNGRIRLNLEHSWRGDTLTYNRLYDELGIRSADNETTKKV